MRIRDYLAGKTNGYGTSPPTRAECEALGVPFPPKTGWLDVYGDWEIEGERQERLSAALDKLKKKKGRKGEMANRGLSLLKYGMGVSHTWASLAAQAKTVESADEALDLLREMNVLASWWPGGDICLRFPDDFSHRDMNAASALVAKFGKDVFASLADGSSGVEWNKAGNGRADVKSGVLVKDPARKPLSAEAQRMVKEYDFCWSKEFLLSYEWRQLRMQVLKRDGARCACCGATPDDGVRMHVDHIKPRKHYPELALEPSNLQVLCEECNHGKGNWDETDWNSVSDNRKAAKARRKGGNA